MPSTNARVDVGTDANGPRTAVLVSLRSRDADRKRAEGKLKLNDSDEVPTRCPVSVAPLAAVGGGHTMRKEERSGAPPPGVQVHPEACQPIRQQRVPGQREGRRGEFHLLRRGRLEALGEWRPGWDGTRMHVCSFRVAVPSPMCGRCQLVSSSTMTITLRPLSTPSKQLPDLPRRRLAP